MSKEKSEVNLTMGKSRPQESELNQGKYWDERDPHAKYNAVSDAC
jgi:predicted lysophospholipase L1 biosynthesis ABC-type transport system permease subunit